MLSLALALAQSPAPALDAPQCVDDFVAAVAAWVDEKPDASLAKIRESFSADMRTALSEKAIDGVILGLRDSGDVRASVVEAKTEGTTRVWRLLLEQEHTLWITTVALDVEDHVSGWWVQPAPRLQSRAELDAETAALAGDVGLSIEIFDSAQKRLDGLEVERGRQLFPLGSIFKLYVLAELARQVDLGLRSLDDELTVEEAKKSLPSGEMQKLADGTKVKLRDAARDMIRISDNTATDHLLHLLGRDKVEAGLDHCFVTEPDRLRPFLSTLEMFASKSLTKEQNKAVFGIEKLDDVARAWRDATPDARRAWLVKLDALIVDGDVKKNRSGFGVRYGLTTMNAHQHVEIEWLVHPRDVVHLVAAAQRGELYTPGASKIFLEFYAEGAPIYGLPGVVAHGYKGGSETNVFALSTRVVLADGRSVIACIQRSGFPATDAKADAQTIGVFNGWIRNFIEGDPKAESPPATKK
ncbi:MAG: serine hydrolase [Planctomycetes bacterium]|nr:serine hydrolase [Planctomycetota bacterium]